MIKKPKLLALTSSLDLALIFLYTFISYLGFSALAPRLTNMGDIITANPSLLTAGLGSGAPFGVSLEAYAQFNTIFKEILWISVIYVIIVFVVSSSAFALNWYYANKFIKKLNFRKFFLRFTYVFGVYYAAFILLAVISLKWSFSTLFQNERTINAFLVIISVIIIYFLLYSLSILRNNNFREVFKKTFRNAFSLDYLASFIVVVVFFIAIDVISRFINWITFGNIGYLTWVIVTALMFIPAITFCRIFLIKVMKK